MPTKTFDPNLGDGHFLWGPNQPNKSGESITLAPTAVDLPSGTVLGKITASGLYVPLNPAAADGSQNFAGILWGTRFINAANQRAAAVVRDVVVNGNLLTYINALTAPQLAAVVAAASAVGVMIRK